MKIYIVENCKDFSDAKAAVLQDYAPDKRIETRYEATGQPSLYCDGKKCGFMSISHTKNTLAIAFSHLPVGIDLERADRAISKRVAANAEEWTRREAYGKMLGNGINREILQCELPREIIKTFAFKDMVVSICSSDLECELKTMIDIER